MENITVGEILYSKPVKGSLIQDNAWYQVLQLKDGKVVMLPEYGRRGGKQADMHLTLPIERVQKEFQRECPFAYKPETTEAPVMPKNETPKPVKSGKIRMDEPIEAEKVVAPQSGNAANQGNTENEAVQ